MSELLVAKMMSWCEAIASTARFADVALSDVADKRVMKKRPISDLALLRVPISDQTEILESNRKHLH